MTVSWMAHLLCGFGWMAHLLCGFGSLIVRFFACLSCAFGSANVMSYTRVSSPRSASAGVRSPPSGPPGAPRSSARAARGSREPGGRPTASPARLQLLQRPKDAQDCHSHAAAREAHQRPCRAGARRPRRRTTAAPASRPPPRPASHRLRGGHAPALPPRPTPGLAARRPSSPAPPPSSTLAQGLCAVTPLSSSFVTKRPSPHPLWHNGAVPRSTPLNLYDNVHYAHTSQLQAAPSRATPASHPRHPCIPRRRTLTTPLDACYSPSSSLRRPRDALPKAYDPGDALQRTTP